VEKMEKKGLVAVMAIVVALASVFLLVEKARSRRFNGTIKDKACAHYARFGWVLI